MPQAARITPGRVHNRPKCHFSRALTADPRTRQRYSRQNCAQAEALAAPEEQVPSMGHLDAPALG